MSKAALKSALIEKARKEGFEHLGVTAPNLSAKAINSLHAFLSSGQHGDMTWMEEKKERRSNPRTLWPEVRSVIMLSMNYGPAENPLKALEETSNGVISVYAKGKDYHNIIKQKLKNIARWLVNETGAEVKVFVDTAPVMEKPLSAAAGLGWQGKHTNLVSRQAGSWLFLGAIYTTAELPLDDHEVDHCGRCRKCLDVCPTKAFDAPYRLNASRCISYLTIEHKGHIPRHLRSAMGNHIYGCDDCLAICPWNKFARTAKEHRFHARDETDNPELAELLKMDDQSFRTRFKGTPIKRTGRNRFIRNCLIAAGNSQDASLKPLIIGFIKDKNEPDIVRLAAIWACRQLSGQEEWRDLKARFRQTETDAAILDEWDTSKAHHIEA